MTEEVYEEAVEKFKAEGRWRLVDEIQKRALWVIPFAADGESSGEMPA